MAPSSPPPSSSSPAITDLVTPFPAETCIRKGLCPVTSLRSQTGPVDTLLESHSLYYEQHGIRAKQSQASKSSGAQEAEHEHEHKVVFIMGLNSSSFSWGPQVRHFGNKQGFTALVFDNRGVGHSGYPRGPYTTSGMAEDVICLLDNLGWTGERDLHVVGISLGGMIAQELAYRIPKRIASLMLAVTTPGGHIWNNFPPLAGVKALGKLLVTPDPIKKVPTVLPMLFPVEWLNEKAKDDPQGRTNYQVQTEGYFARVAITKPQEFMGHISQMAAGLTHYCSPDRLAYIARNIPKIIIATGDDDHLVRPIGSKRIYEAMVAQKGPNGEGGVDVDVELVEWEKTGHGVHIQQVEAFNELIERGAIEGDRKVREGYKGADV